MWIKMLRDQARPWGIFQTGQTHSLPLPDVEKLDSDSYVEVNVDEQAMERMGVEERIKHFTAEIATLDSAMQAAQQRLADLKQRRKRMRDKMAEAKKKIRQLEPAETETQAKGASDGQTETTKPAAREGVMQGPPQGD